MKKIIAAVLTLFMATLSDRALAGSASGAHITMVVPDTTSMSLYTDVSHASMPACATGDGRFVIDLTTPGGQSLAAAVLTAMSSHMTVDVVGSNACTVETNEESVAHIIVHSNY